MSALFDEPFFYYEAHPHMVVDGVAWKALRFQHRPQEAPPVDVIRWPAGHGAPAPTAGPWDTVEEDNWPTTLEQLREFAKQSTWIWPPVFR